MGRSYHRARSGVSCWWSQNVTHEQELTFSGTWDSRGKTHLLLSPLETLCRAAAPPHSDEAQVLSIGH